MKNDFDLNRPFTFLLPEFPPPSTKLHASYAGDCVERFQLHHRFHRSLGFMTRARLPFRDVLRPVGDDAIRLWEKGAGPPAVRRGYLPENIKRM